MNSAKDALQIICERASGHFKWLLLNEARCNGVSIHPSLSTHSLVRATPALLHGRLS